MRGQVGERRAIVCFQRRRIVVGRRDVEAPDAGGLERRRRIVSRAVDRSSQRRRRLDHFEFVVGGHVEDSGLARVVDKPERGVAIPRDHLGVGLRIVFRQFIEDGAHRGGAFGGKRPAVGLADLARQIDHLFLRRFDDRPRLFVKLRGGLVDVEVVLERPVVFGFAHRETIAGEFVLLSFVPDATSI